MILFSYSYSVFGNGNCSSSSTAAVDKSQRNTILMWASKAEEKIYYGVELKATAAAAIIMESKV